MKRRKNEKKAPLFVFGLLLTWLPFAPLLLDSSRTLLYRDLTNLYLPLKTLWLNAFLELGRIPHWNPFHALGIPFFSDPTYGTFHPFNVLFLLFKNNPARGLVFFLLAHHLLLYCGGYLLARSLKARPAVALLGGWGLAWSGFALSSTYNPHDLAGICAVPFYFYFLRRSRREPAYLFAAAMALAWPVLTGNAQFSYMLALISLYLWIFAKEKMREAKRLLLMFLPAILFCAPQLFPTITHFSETTRAGGVLDDAAQLYWSLHPARLLEFISPLPFGDRPDFGRYSGYAYVDSALRSDPFVFTFYPGMFCSLFGLLYLLLKVRKPGRWKRLSFPIFLGVLLLLFLAMGRLSPLPIYSLLAKCLPLWGAFRYPERLAFWLAFLAWWGGILSMEKILRLSGKVLPRPRLPLFVAACVLLCAADLGAVASRLVWTQPVAYTSKGGPSFHEKIFADRTRQAGSLLLGSARRLYNLPPAAIDENDRASISERETEGGSLNRETKRAWNNFRYYTGSYYGLPLAIRHNTLVPRRQIYDLESGSAESLNRFLDLASVRYLVLETDRTVVARPLALPFVFAPEKVEAISSAAVGEKLADKKWNPKNQALVEGPAETGENPLNWSLQRVEQNWDTITLFLRSVRVSARPSWLVVNESFDPNWKAWWWGKSDSLTMARANGWAQAILLPEAKSVGQEAELRLVYTEHSFFLGCLALVLALALSSFLGLSSPGRKRLAEFLKK
ncbi:MAG TPA: hypothetical protein VIH99_06075 [Bdellovibrionota bacterium]|jgi:hypothetical protein